MFIFDPQPIFPTLDIYETKEELVIEAEVPGVTVDMIKVICVSDKIIIEGEKRERLNMAQIKFLRMERFNGHFKRVIQLPFVPKEEEIKANLKDGVLVIRIAKRVKSIDLSKEEE